jgi:5'-nucleotidase
LEISKMKKLIVVALPVLMLVVAVGCANNKNNVPKNKSVTEIGPSPVAAPHEPQPYAGPLNGAPQAQPTYYEPAVTQAPGAAGPASGAGGAYTVKKGDTLFSIAKANYGNGNQWQRIAQANPGLAPNTLKAGQRIVIP